MNMGDSSSAKPLAVIIALIAVICTSLAVSRFSDYQQTSTASNLWANAVLNSLSPNDDAATRTLDRFAVAIAGSDDSSNIYVSLGDYLRGPAHVAEAWQQAFGNDQELVEAAISDPDALYTKADGIISIMNRDDQAAAAYAAAVCENSTNRLAHFRVAVYGDTDAGIASSQWLTANDSSNALGLYLEAAYALEHAPDSVLQLMQAAVSRPAIHFPPDVIPELGTTTFPQFFEQFSGQPVTKSALRFIVHRQNSMFDFNDPVRNAIERVLDHVAQIADDCGDPHSESAILIHQHACHQLVFNTSAKLSLSFSGIFRHDDSHKLLSRLAPTHPMIKTCELKHKQVQRFGQLLKSHWGPSNEEIRKFTPEMIFSGTVDPVTAETALVTQVQEMALQP